jgi:hypothetical protein
MPHSDRKPNTLFAFSLLLNSLQLEILNRKPFAALAQYLPFLNDAEAKPAVRARTFQTDHRAGAAGYVLNIWSNLF